MKIDRVILSQQALQRPYHLSRFLGGCDEFNFSPVSCIVQFSSVLQVPTQCHLLHKFSAR